MAQHRSPNTRCPVCNMRRWPYDPDTSLWCTPCTRDALAESMLADEPRKHHRRKQQRVDLRPHHRWERRTDYIPVDNQNPTTKETDKKDLTQPDVN